MPVTEENRYARQVALDEIGPEGQERLRGSVAAVIGVGALGSVAAELLARAGIGTLILADPDIVELTNLQRQSLYAEPDIGSLKVRAVEQHLQLINRDVVVRIFAKAVHRGTLALLDDADVVLDCTDNFQTRFLLNEYCSKRKVPFIYCGAVETRGMVYAVAPGRACFNCLFEGRAAVEDCESSGVLNAASHVAASLQVAEVLKALLGAPLTPGIVSFNVWETRFDVFAVKPRVECAVCRGVYERLSGTTPQVEFCATRRLVKVRPNQGVTFVLERVKNLVGVTVVESYGDHAAVLSVEGVTVLALGDGSLEIQTRDADVARRVVGVLYGTAN